MGFRLGNLARSITKRTFAKTAPAKNLAAMRSTAPAPQTFLKTFATREQARMDYVQRTGKAPKTAAPPTRRKLFGFGR